MTTFRRLSRTSSTRRALLGVLPLLTLGFLLSACGGGSPASGASSSTSSTSAGTTNSFQAYAACLQRNGVKLPTGGFRPHGGTGTTGAGSAPRPAAGGTGNTGRGGGFFGGGGGGGFASNPAFQKAEKACASLRPTGGFGGGGGFSGAGATELRTYLNCLEIHGLKVPSGSGSAAFSYMRTLFTHPTPKEKAAVKACASLRPKFGSGGHRPPGGTTTTTTAA